ncbi:MAG: transposase [Kiritimatiellae bacterium]|nr:transposase [Kiritimatiellia bacterium]MDD3543908.1 transposase [Kiritimatiellia bacterium]MDD4024576.1 transposase [Kiritimatiellia bacterium]
MRDRADGNALKEMTLTCAEFVGRFPLHILPKGFQKVRAYGFLAPRAKKAALAAIREVLGAEPIQPPPKDETAPERVLRLTGVDVTLCPVCKAGRLSCVHPDRKPRSNPIARGRPPRLRSTHFIPYAAK